MIGEYTLFQLCEKYNIDSEKIVNKKNNILDYSDYAEIDKTLNYLINELHIAPINIEKCPSILYRNVGAIKFNVKFLNQNHINFANIESCLRVLSTDPKELERTYSYVLRNYDLHDLSRNTLILSVNEDFIKEVENLNLPLPKNGNLTIAVALEYGTTTMEEVQKIIQSTEFKEHPELFSSQTLAHAKLEDIRDLLNVDYWKDERFKHLLTSSVVASAKSMLAKMPVQIQIAETFGIDKVLNVSFLLLPPEQNYALVMYCNANNIPLIVGDALNPIFGVQPDILKQKYNINIADLMTMYPLKNDDNNLLEGKKNEHIK